MRTSLAVRRPAARVASIERGVALLSAVVFLYWASMYTYVATLPVYARSMGASMGTIGLLVGAYGFSQMVLRVPIGVLSDRWGRRRPFVMLGFVAAALGAAGLALAPTPELLVLYRALVGVAAANWVATSVLFMTYFESDQVGRAVGLASFLSGIAQLVATMLGGKVADDLGPVAPFGAAVALAALGLLLTTLIREQPVPRQPPPVGRLVRVAFIPSLLAVSGIAALVQWASWATTYAFLPLYADQLGATGTELGLLTSASVVLYTLTTLLVAPLVRRQGARGVIALGIALLAASVVVVPHLTGLAILAVSQGLGGVGRGLAFTALMSESVAAVDPAERATAMGAFQAIYAVGMFVGPATAGVVAEHLGLAGAFSTSGLILILGLAAALALVHQRSGVSTDGAARHDR